jgi:iron complex outermembrane receptor protein
MAFATVVAPPSFVSAQARQTSFDTTAIVRVRVLSKTQPVEGAGIRSGSIVAHTDIRGQTQLALPPGERWLVIRKIGFAPDSLYLLLRAGMDTAVTVELRAQAVVLESMVVTATRGERRVEDEPIRVEVLDREEAEEKAMETPGGVAHLLAETGGVRIAQTSPAFGAVNIRVQGLRGRYTQLLSDGLPLFGFSTEGLGLLQIPPVELDRVELIKGAASALYGPTALGGVVNLVSRRPSEGPAFLELVANQTSRGGTDAIFYGSAALSARWGYTLLTSAHRQSRQDLDRDGWADLPSYQRAVVRPRLLWNSSDGNTALLTAGFTTEGRSGGGVAPGGVPFMQERVTRRADAGAVGRILLGGQSVLTVRGSATREWRRDRFGKARDRYQRTALFGEAALIASHGTHNGVLGIAFQRDALSAEGSIVDYRFAAPGVFLQHTWTPNEWLGVTSSGRLDLHNEYGMFLSPRVSLLVRPAGGWNVRLAAGGGGYAPTPFVEEVEEIGLFGMRPFLGRLRAERAGSVSVDVGGVVGPVEVISSAYASVVTRPAAVRTAAGAPDSLELVNLAEPTRTRGAEFVAVYRLGAYRVTATYGYLHATEQDPETGLRRAVPLTPRHSAGVLFTWEPRDGSGVGLEAFYTGRQSLAEDPYRAESRPYLTVGAMVRWGVGRAILFVNGENLTGVRQTKFDPLLRATPGLGGRWTVDAWAPLEGRVVNLGVKLRLGETESGTVDSSGVPRRLPPFHAEASSPIRQAYELVTAAKLEDGAE